MACAVEQAWHHLGIDEVFRDTGPHPRLRWIKQLFSDSGVELCVIVQVVLDDRIALARGFREPSDVEDADFSTGVFDKSFSLENPGCRRNCGTATAKHVCEKLMRNLERVDMRTVRADEEPAGESLFEVVFRIASSGLHCLNELCLNIAECKKLKDAAKAELSSRILHVAAIAMAGNLGVDAIQALLRSHQSRDPYDRLITEHPDLDLRPIHERCRHRRHSLFEKIEVIDRVARVFDFMFQFEFDRLQSKALNDLRVQCLQKSVLKAARAQ